ncbi:MAG: DUF4136 domain-containing protein [Rikenellaceae bacterium]
MKKYLLHILAVSLVAISCSPITLNSSKVLNESDIYQCETFSMPKLIAAELPMGVTQKDIERLHATIAKELESRGLKQVEAKADMQVSVKITVQKNINRSVSGSSSAFGTVTVNSAGVTRANAGMNVSSARLTSRDITTNLSRTGIIALNITNGLRENPLYFSQVRIEFNGTTLALKDNEMLEKAADLLFKKLPIEEI